MNNILLLIIIILLILVPIYAVVGIYIHALYERRFLTKYGVTFDKSNDLDGIEWSDGWDYKFKAALFSTLWPLIPILYLGYFLLIYITLMCDVVLNKSSGIRNKIRNKIVFNESNGASDKNKDSGSPYRENK